MKRIRRLVENFFLAPADATPIAFLRIGIACILLAQAWMLRTSVLDFFASDGIIQGELARLFAERGAPRISWITEALASFHPSEATVIHAVCWTYVVSLTFLGLGFFAQIAAAASWLLHWTLMSSGQSTSYGVDLYAHVFLFYLVWMPCGARLSLDAWRKGASAPSSGARLGLRVLQLHLCLSYFFSAIEKAQGIQWWNGELLWRAMTLPEYRQFDMTWLAHWPSLSLAAGLMSLLLEAGYCIMIWPRRTRPFWIAGIAGLHLGITALLGLHLFGMIMAMLTLVVFGISAEPAARRWPQLTKEVYVPSLW